MFLKQIANSKLCVPPNRGKLQTQNCSGIKKDFILCTIGKIRFIHRNGKDENPHDVNRTIHKESVVYRSSRSIFAKEAERSISRSIKATNRKIQSEKCEQKLSYRGRSMPIIEKQLCRERRSFRSIKASRKIGQTKSNLKDVNKTIHTEGCVVCRSSRNSSAGRVEDFDR